MSRPQFVYTTCIETGAEKRWQALTDGDFTERYWLGDRLACDCQAACSYRFAKPGAPGVEGKLLSAEPRRLGCSWNPCPEESRREGLSRVAFDIEPQGKAVRLTLTHDEPAEGGGTLRAICAGCPIVIASLESLLEPDHGLEIVPPSRATAELSRV